MSGKSKSSSRKKSDESHLRRAFQPGILKQAAELASQYRLILEPDEEVGFMGTSIEMPHVWGDGKTPDACVRETRDAIVSAIATLLEAGEAVPMPSNENQRTEQINIRVTPKEKLLLEEAARSKGFRGISDFVRATTLSKAS